MSESHQDLVEDLATQLNVTPVWPPIEEVKDEVILLSREDAIALRGKGGNTYTLISLLQGLHREMQRLSDAHLEFDHQDH